MRLRVATFNVENLLRRTTANRDRDTGQWIPDTAVGLFEHSNEVEGRLIERAFLVAVSDDTRQMTAQAVRDLDADVVCLQEVDDLEALRYFHDKYVRRAVDVPYEHFASMQGNDRRGIDVAVMSRRGFPFRVQSHAALTYRDLGLFNDDIRRLGRQPDDRVFTRDCLEVEVEVGARRLTLFVVHFKSMNDGRDRTMPLRRAEARAVRGLVERRFGRDAPYANWLIVGDCNDYREQLFWRRDGDGRRVVQVEPAAASGLDPFFADRFALNLVERLPRDERWTHFYADDKSLTQLDYIFASPALAAANAKVRPEIVRAGLPYRVPTKPTDAEGRPLERYPRVGFDRPKASDHCPVVVALDIPDDGRDDEKDVR